MSAAARTLARPRSRAWPSDANGSTAGRAVGVPPQVRHRIHAVVRLDDERGVLLAVARRQPQLAVRREPVAVAVVVEPQVVAVARPEVDDLGVREQGAVDGVIRVVMAQEDVGHRVGLDAEGRQRVEDQRAAGDHARVDNDDRVAVADQHDGAGRVLAGVARHGGGRPRSRWMLRGTAAAGRGRRGGRDVASRVQPGCHPCGGDPPATRSRRRPHPANGRVATMDAARRFASAVAVTRGRIAAVGDDADGPPADRPAHPGRRPPWSDGHPWVRRCARPSGLVGRRAAALRPDRASRPRPVSRCDRVIRGGTTRTPPGSAAAAGRWPTSRTASHPAPTSTGSRRIARSTSRAATGMRAWVNGRALELAGIDASTADPLDGRIEHDATGEPSGALQEAARDLVVRILPPTTTDDLVTGLRLAQAELHALGITSWQDAQVRPEEEEIAYVALAGRGELTARVVGALGWDELRGADQIDELVERRARTAAPSLPADQREVLRRRRSSRTSAARCRRPYLGRDGRPTGDRGRSMIEPEALGHTWRGSTRSASSRTSTPSANGPFARPSTRSTSRARRTARATPGRTSRTSSSSIPDDIRALPRARRGGQRPGRLGGPRGSARAPDAPLPRAGARRLAVYPFALAAARRGAAGDGLRLERVHRRSVAPDGGRGQLGSATRIAARSRRSSPTSGSRLEDALAAFTLGSAWVNHLEAEVGSIEVGKAGRPGRARSRPVRPGGRRDRRGAGGRHVRRRRRGPRGRRARGLSPAALGPRRSALAAWTHDDVDSAPDVGGWRRWGWAMMPMHHGTHPGQRKGETQ